jgi:hypothetical protein
MAAPLFLQIGKLPQKEPIPKREECTTHEKTLHSGEKRGKTLHSVV